MVEANQSPKPVKDFGLFHFKAKKRNHNNAESYCVTYVAVVKPYSHSSI